MYKSEDNGSDERCRITNISDKMITGKRKTRFPKAFHLLCGSLSDSEGTNCHRWTSNTQTKLNSQTTVILTLYLLMWKIWWAPNNASKGQMGFNPGFKGLNVLYPFISANPSNSHSQYTHKLPIFQVTVRNFNYQIYFKPMHWYFTKFLTKCVIQVACL